MPISASLPTALRRDRPGGCRFRPVPCCLAQLPPSMLLDLQDRGGQAQLMGTIERSVPPLNADERVTLQSWLDFHRTTLAQKCEDLDDEQATLASVPPSGLTLTGIVQHMAEVERNW